MAMNLRLRYKGSRSRCCQTCYPIPSAEKAQLEFSRASINKLIDYEGDDEMAKGKIYSSSLPVTCTHIIKTASVYPPDTNDMPMIAEHKLKGWKRFFAFHRDLDAYFLAQCRSILSSLRPSLYILLFGLLLFVSLVSGIIMKSDNHLFTSISTPCTLINKYEENQCESILPPLDLKNKLLYEKQEKILEMQQIKIELMEKKMWHMEHQYSELLHSVNNNNNSQLIYAEQRELLEKSTIKLIRDQIDVYDSDHVGMADFASHSMGGRVVSTPNTHPYLKKFISGFMNEFIPSSLFNFNHPEEIMEPGKCWAFKGSRGNMIIQFATRIYISAVTLDHVSPKLTPFGNIQSAPKDFIIFGMSEDAAHVALGRFSYDQDGSRRQTFNVERAANTSFKSVMLSILTNHGEPSYTCVYRLRVHGRVAEQPAGLE